MAKSPLDRVLRYLRRATLPVGTDQFLLTRFAVDQDEVAFESLLKRHGPMVWNICRRVLHHGHDAEDAFQATFLVLVRKAASLKANSCLSNWLYTVAYRISLRARAQAARRQKHESKAASIGTEDPDCNAIRNDLRSVLDAELSQLPEKYRAPLVLCHLQGKSYDEAARQLGWTLGTVSGRLARGREMLRTRLIRRGLTLSAAALASTLDTTVMSAALPLGLTTSTVKTASLLALGGAASEMPGAVAILMKGALTTMFLAKIRLAVMLVGIIALASGVGVMGRQNLPDKLQLGQKEEVHKKANPLDHSDKDAKQAKIDLFGDPLPTGALARLGTMRWRTPKAVDVIAFAPDGKTVAVASHGLESLRLFDATSGKATKNLSLPKVSYDYYVDYKSGLAFSSDGMRLAAVAMNGHVQVHHLGGGSKLEEFKVPQSEAGKLRWLGWSVDDQLLAVFAAKGAILVRVLKTGREQRFEIEDIGDIHSVDQVACSYTAAGKILAASDELGTVHVWDATTGKKRCALKLKNENLRTLVFSPDGRTLASLVSDAKGVNTVQLWDTFSTKATHSLVMRKEYVRNIAFSPDGNTLATVDSRHVRFWNVADGQEIGRTTGADNFGTSLAFSPDSKTLATTENHGGVSSGVVHLWDISTGSLKPEPMAQTNAPGSMAFSPDGQRLASGGRDGTIFVWDLNTSKSLTRINKGGPVQDCAFSDDGKAILSCWNSNRLYFSDAATGDDLHSVKLEDPTRPDKTQRGHRMHLSDDGKTLIALSTNEDREYLVTGWNALTRKQIFARPLQRFEPWGAFWGKFTPDGKTWAIPQVGPGQDLNGKTLGGSGPIALGDVATGEFLLTFPVVAGPTFPLGFSPDGRLLATATRDYGAKQQIVRLWEVTTATEVLALPTESNTRIAFSHDSRLLALVAPRQEILIWDLCQGREVGRITGFGADVSSLAFSPDGRRLVSGLSDTTILVWDVGMAPQGIPRSDADGVVQAWVDLAGDARKAFAARNAFASSPALTLRMLKERLHPAQPADAQRLASLLTELGNDQFAVRQKAQKALEEMGELPTDAYRRTLAEKPSLEVRQRIEGLLQKLRGPVTRPQKLQAMRAVAVLEDIASPEARQLLENLAKGEPEARVTQEAQASLGRLARRN